MDIKDVKVGDCIVWTHNGSSRNIDVEDWKPQDHTVHIGGTQNNRIWFNKILKDNEWVDSFGTIYARDKITNNIRKYDGVCPGPVVIDDNYFKKGGARRKSRRKARKARKSRKNKKTRSK